MTGPARFPTSVLPDEMRVFVEALSGSTCTDPSYAGLASLVTAAACVGNRVAVQAKPGWTEPAVLWGALVGRSGDIKTPVLKATTQPLIDIYKERRRDYESGRQKYECDRQRYHVDLRRWQRSTAQGGNVDPPVEPILPVEKRVLVSDTTIERLGVLLRENPLGLLMMRDELAGWTGSFDRYVSGGKGADQAAWLSMYDASPIVVDRKAEGGSVFVERAAVSVLGTIQPGVLDRVFGASERDSGLLARLLLAFPEKRPAVWTDACLPDDVAGGWRTMLAELLAIPPDYDDEGAPCPRLLPIADEARGTWIEWHDQHARETADLDDEHLGAHFAKLRGACLRMALVLECTDVTGGGVATSVGPDAVGGAIQLIEWFKAEAQRLYTYLVETDAQRDRRQLLDCIRRKGGSITPRQLVQSVRTYRGRRDDAVAALEALHKAGLGFWDCRQNGPGRPSDRFVLGTSVYETTAEQPPMAVFNSVDSVDARQLNVSMDYPDNDDGRIWSGVRL